MANRWWIYQRERFPVFQHGALIFAFSFCAVCYSSLLRSESDAQFPPLEQVVISFVVVFVFFGLLRITDEFKDFDDDAKYRPYRPIPRGLVTLRELAVVGVFGCVLQLVLSLLLQPILAVILVVVWLYLGLMTKEFFIAEWLKAHPITYMWTHMLIMPLVDFYATACDWTTAGHVVPPHGLQWFLFVSFFNGVVIEIGRKVRAPEDEEKGVETYSVLWGHRNASLVWIGAILAGAVFALLAAKAIAFVLPVICILIILFSGCLVCAARFVALPISRRARLIETASGLWVIAMYLSLGAVPIFLRG